MVHKCQAVFTAGRSMNIPGSGIHHFGASSIMGGGKEGGGEGVRGDGGKGVRGGGRIKGQTVNGHQAVTRRHGGLRRGTITQGIITADYDQCWDPPGQNHHPAVTYALTIVVDRIIEQ